MAPCLAHTEIALESVPTRSMMGREPAWRNIDIGRLVILSTVATLPPISLPARVIRSHAPMEQCVIRAALADHEVRRAIVGSLRIDVVHTGSCWQRATEGLLGHERVFKLIASLATAQTNVTIPTERA